MGVTEAMLDVGRVSLWHVLRGKVKLEERTKKDSPFVNIHRINYRGVPLGRVGRGPLPHWSSIPLAVSVLCSHMIGT